ncbi:MAG: hypothetical protein ACOCP4_00960 [Candidatus Woesearchaeota archaeon]
MGQENELYLFYTIDAVEEALNTQLKSLNYNDAYAKIISKDLLEYMQNNKLVTKGEDGYTFASYKNSYVDQLINGDKEIQDVFCRNCKIKSMTTLFLIFAGIITIFLLFY